MRRCVFLYLVTVMAGQNTASAIWATVDIIPVERLIANTAAYIQENPADPQGYYTLARIHYRAFADASAQVSASAGPEGRLPQLQPDWLWRDRRNFRRRQQKERPPDFSGQELNEHAALASENFEKVIELDPNNALYHLGLAGLLEQYADFVKTTYGIPEAFSSILFDKAKETYYQAYALSVETDTQLESVRGIEGGPRALVSYEAGQAYVRLSPSESALSPSEKELVESIQRNVDKLCALPGQFITPIVFSLSRHKALPDLIASGVQARFDLDGDGVVEAWPWVRPETGILVWDPEQTGKITSGRQFFGSVTWWLFFANGYRALDSLDDNRDSTLSGEELAGISVWFDRNSNAQADDGEVIPVGQFGVISLSTQITGFDGNSPMNSAGLELMDGRTVPTYDWITSPAPANAPGL